MTFTTPLSALKYYGGKSPQLALNRWIASQLPHDKIYAEPFAGMAGILLARKPSQTEIINDLDGRVTNWWATVRDHPNELIARLNDTPWDENTYNTIWATDWTTQTPLWQAWAFTIICEMSFSSDNTTRHFKRFNTNESTHHQPWAQKTTTKINRLKHRLIGVQIYNYDAIKFLNTIAPHTNAIIYADPPYYTANDNYTQRGYDINQMTHAFTQLKGRCLISGYPGEWDHLGWHHNDHHRIATTGHGSTPVTERVWANYPLTTQNTLFDTTTHP